MAAEAFETYAGRLDGGVHAYSRSQQSAPLHVFSIEDFITAARAWAPKPMGLVTALASLP